MLGVFAMVVGSRPVVVGRDVQLAALERLVGRATQGRGGLAWIEGEPGIGKTALADAVASRAEAAGHRVLRGSGDELMEPFPLRLMVECLQISARSPEPAVAEIAVLLRGGGDQLGAAGPVLAAAERMLELVDRLCGESPVTLIVEDLHCADEHSVLLWGRLARAVDQIPLLLVGVTRPVPHREAVERLRAFVDRREGTVVELAPLGPSEVAELAGRIAGGVPGPRLMAELERAGGNPLYVSELVETLLGAGSVTVTHSTAELRGDAGAMPSSLAVAIGRRLGFMSELSRRALRVAALLGEEVDAGNWALATGRPVLELADVAAEAVAGGVLSDASGRLRFRHEVIRQALLSQVPVSVREALHASIARTLAEAGRGVDVVAPHLLAVREVAGDWEPGWLARIGEPALYAAPQVSAELLQRAVGALEPDDPLWMVLATRLTLVLFWLGRDGDAAYAMAGEVARRTDDPVLRCRMRIQMIRLAGRAGRAEQVLPIALSRADDALPAPWRSRLDAWSSLILRDAGQAEVSLAIARDALERAEDSGDPLSIATAWHALASCDDAAARPGQMRSALAALTGRDMESADMRMLLLANFVVQLQELGRPRECEQTLAEALRLADRSGTFRTSIIIRSAISVCYQHGRHDEALVHIASIDGDLVDARWSQYVYAEGAIIAMHREDRVTADADLLAAAGPGPFTAHDPPVPQYKVTEALAMRAEADGDLPLALALMTPWLDAQAGLSRDERHDDLPYLTYLALAVGDKHTARRAVQVAEADAVADPAPSRSCTARFCRALVDDDTGELLALGAEFQGYQWMVKAAFAFEEAAIRLAQAGDTARARAALNDAVRIYADMGASWNIKRADAKLRRYAIRRGPRSIHRRATVGWEALTPSEHAIAELVAHGRSNPDIAAELFLSRRTVQSHVSRILTKLQMHSRIEVVRAVAERQA
jgi:DNA-binding CsgD family transcriptional regulator